MSLARCRPSMLEIRCSLSLCTSLPRDRHRRGLRHSLHCVSNAHHPSSHDKSRLTTRRPLALKSSTTYSASQPRAFLQNSSFSSSASSHDHSNKTRKSKGTTPSKKSLSDVRWGRMPHETEGEYLKQEPREVNGLKNDSNEGKAPWEDYPSRGPRASSMSGPDLPEREAPFRSTKTTRDEAERRKQMKGERSKALKAEQGRLRDQADQGPILTEEQEARLQTLSHARPRREREEALNLTQVKDWSLHSLGIGADDLEANGVLPKRTPGGPKVHEYNESDFRLGDGDEDAAVMTSARDFYDLDPTELQQVPASSMIKDDILTKDDVFLKPEERVWERKSLQGDLILDTQSGHEVIEPGDPSATHEQSMKQSSASEKLETPPNSSGIEQRNRKGMFDEGEDRISLGSRSPESTLAPNLMGELERDQAKERAKAVIKQIYDDIKEKRYPDLDAIKEARKTLQSIYALEYDLASAASRAGKENSKQRTIRLERRQIFRKARAIGDRAKNIKNAKKKRKRKRKIAARTAKAKSQSLREDVYAMFSIYTPDGQKVVTPPAENISNKETPSTTAESQHSHNQHLVRARLIAAEMQSRIEEIKNARRSKYASLQDLEKTFPTLLKWKEKKTTEKKMMQRRAEVKRLDRELFDMFQVRKTLEREQREQSPESDGARVMIQSRGSTFQNERLPQPDLRETSPEQFRRKLREREARWTAPSRADVKQSPSRDHEYVVYPRAAFTHKSHERTLHFNTSLKYLDLKTKEPLTPERMLYVAGKTEREARFRLQESSHSNLASDAPQKTKDDSLQDLSRIDAEHVVPIRKIGYFITKPGYKRPSTFNDNTDSSSKSQEAPISIEQDVQLAAALQSVPVHGAGFTVRRIGKEVTRQE